MTHNKPTKSIEQSTGKALSRCVYEHNTIKTLLNTIHECGETRITGGKHTQYVSILANDIGYQGVESTLEARANHLKEMIVKLGSEL